MAIQRAKVRLLMKQAFAEGQSASSFIQAMQATGMSYRRSDMLADWRTENELVKKEGLLRYLGRDRYPATTMVAKDWDKMSKEFMYKVRVESRLKPDEPPTERFVNIMSDVPLTRGEIEEQTYSAWGEWEKYSAEEITGLQAWSAIQRAE